MTHWPGRHRRSTRRCVSPRPSSASTSAAADASEHFTDREQAIIDLLSEYGAMVLFQLAERLGVPDHTISGRITSLKTKRAIEITGERIRTPRGSMADVYRLSRHCQRPTERSQLDPPSKPVRPAIDQPASTPSSPDIFPIFTRTLRFA
jgi:hypothetical protein